MEVEHPKAFVSSTYEDLKAHRAYVIRELRHCGVQVDPMEDWDASPELPKVFSTSRIEGCDLFVLLIGTRLGHVPAGETRSITQLECEQAQRLRIDILPFMFVQYSARDDTSDTPYLLPEALGDPSLQQWRKEISERYGVGVFGPPPESVPVATSVARWLMSRRLPLPTRLSLNDALNESSFDLDVQSFFEGRLDLVKLAFAERFGQQHVVPNFNVGDMNFEYAIVHPVPSWSNIAPSITYVSLRGCHERLLNSSIGEVMNAIDGFLDDPEREEFAPCSTTRGRLIEESLASREDYRGLAFNQFSERAVLVGGRRGLLSKSELELMRRRNSVPGRLRMMTWDSVVEHLEDLLATVRAVK